MNAGIFQQILTVLQDALAPGALAIRDQLSLWITILVAFEVVRTVWTILFHRSHAVEAVLRLVLRGGLTLYAFHNWGDLMNRVIQSGVQLGLLAGGGRITMAQFLDPGAYMQIGLDAGAVLYNTMLANLGLTTIVLALAYLLCWIFFLLAYAVMAVSVFIWQVEVLVASIGALVLLPFALYRATAWIAQGAISFLVNMGFRFMVGALLAAVVFPLLSQPTIQRPALDAAIIAVIASWTLGFLFLKVPSIASGLLSGSPALTAGHVGAAVAATAGVLATAGGASAAGLLAGRGGAQLLTQGTRALLNRGSSAALASPAGGGRTALGGAGAAATRGTTAPALGATAQTPRPGLAAQLRTVGRAIRQEMAPAATQARRSFRQGLRHLEHGRYLDQGGGGTHGPHL